jgi:ribosomal-protein-alanine N-acetyltransferase
MTVSVEQMQWWHLDDVHELEASLFPSDAWTLEQFWQELSQPTRHYVVAVDDGRPVGYAGAFVTATDADVQTIAVAGDHQGRGLASALMSALLAAVADRGATHVLLEVRADNAPAISLYERFGFARISTRPRYYPDGADAVVMRLALADRRRS